MCIKNWFFHWPQNIDHCRSPMSKTTFSSDATGLGSLCHNSFAQWWPRQWHKPFIDKVRGNKKEQRQVIVMQTWLAWSQSHDMHRQVAKHQLTQLQRQTCSVLARSNSEPELGVTIDYHFSLSCQSAGGWKDCLHNPLVYKMKSSERSRAGMIQVHRVYERS